MSHDAKFGSSSQFKRAIRNLAAAQRREATACAAMADHGEAAATASDARSRALRAASRASRELATTMDDVVEAGRTHRQSELLTRQANQADAEAAMGRRRAKTSRAESKRAAAQADTSESFTLTQPKDRGARRGG